MGGEPAARSGHAGGTRALGVGSRHPSHLLWEGVDRELGKAVLEGTLCSIKVIQTLRQSSFADPVS